MQYQIFEYVDESHHDNVTTVEIDGEIWFVGKEVCGLLGIKNVPDAIGRLDDDEKLLSVIPIGGQDRRVNLISESGLYSLVFKSKKPGAKKFKRWVTHEVLPKIRQTGSFGIPATHTFVRRFNENYDRVDRGYFSVIGELYIRLYGQFEMVGYVIPEKTRKNIELRPDNSVGRLFSDWLSSKHPDLAKEWKTYRHKLPNKLEVDARQYKNSVLQHFIEYVETVWIPKRAPDYFKSRAPEALTHLPKLLPGYKGKKPKPLSPLNRALAGIAKVPPPEK